MFYILFDETMIVSTEDFAMAAEYLESGMSLYGYTDQEDYKDLMMYECHNSDGVRNKDKSPY